MLDRSRWYVFVQLDLWNIALAKIHTLSRVSENCVWKWVKDFYKVDDFRFNKWVFNIWGDQKGFFRLRFPLDFELNGLFSIYLMNRNIVTKGSKTVLHILILIRDLYSPSEGGNKCFRMFPKYLLILIFIQISRIRAVAQNSVHIF